MTATLDTVRFSILDRSRVRRGQDHADALRETVEFATLAQRWGFHRFWVAEHHSVPGVAGTAPTVLAAAVAAATDRIRVGTGGVMLPNHQPLVVAEQFGVLGALFPGRIDLGVGRSVGFTDGVRRALSHGHDDAEDFDTNLAELLDYLDAGRAGVRAKSAEGLDLPTFVLATGSGAQRAARFGLPLVIAPIAGHEAMVAAIDRYRAEFQPSARSPRPWVIVSATVMIADSVEQARRLLLPEAWSSAYSRTHGEFPPLVSSAEVEAITMTNRQRVFFEQALGDQIHGTEPEVAAALERLTQQTGADEILVHTSTFDRTARLDSHRRLARLVGLEPVPSGSPSRPANHPVTAL
ncbi:methylene-tetrahydromethanopterin reductase [Nocardia mangyaensis]|uniref:Methylene-tetrahydromethanopterin reductase n=1 Tax=Nocardia mangyaensis TaxID=2213200 RepID=A0A1J0VQS5_9NOCA|nr:MsnO8 family LLM class oxidoreductase [Nocardia mangyaensis]APE34311.1 methylene-tetrahydromethanopterin reductase [Nocardia mangyaensis]